MSESRVTRRDFGRLSAAAVGGLMIGSVVGCKTTSADPAQHVMLNEPHVCCGLNTCKSKGRGGDNACAGQGSCATATEHACRGMNDCKGQGGCGTSAGLNDCKGHGKCAVPLSAKAWKAARANFEKAAGAAGMKVGAAPPGCPKSDS